MARRKSDTPQKAATREMMQEYLRDNDISIKSGTDVNSIMRDMMSVLLEGALDEELNEVNILASGNRISGAVETYIPDTETAFDWLNYHP